MLKGNTILTCPCKSVNISSVNEIKAFW